MKELQGLTVAQRDHILRGMPLSLAEKRCLRSVPLGLVRTPAPLPRLGVVVGEKGPEPAVGGWSLGGSGPSSDAASAPREESRPPRGKRRAQGRHGLLSCCSRLRDSCILVGASGRLGAGALRGATCSPSACRSWGPLAFSLALGVIDPPSPSGFPSTAPAL